MLYRSYEKRAEAERLPCGDMILGIKSEGKVTP